MDSLTTREREMMGKFFSGELPKEILSPFAPESLQKESTPVQQDQEQTPLEHPPAEI